MLILPALAMERVEAGRGSGGGGDRGQRLDQPVPGLGLAARGAAGLVARTQDADFRGTGGRVLQKAWNSVDGVDGVDGDAPEAGGALGLRSDCARKENSPRQAAAYRGPHMGALPLAPGACPYSAVPGGTRRTGTILTTVFADDTVPPAGRSQGASLSTPAVLARGPFVVLHLPRIGADPRLRPRPHTHQHSADSAAGHALTRPFSR